MALPLLLPLLLFLGCTVRLTTLHLPLPPLPSTSSIELRIENHLETPWVVGYLEEPSRKITIDHDIGAYIKGKFLQRVGEKCRAPLNITLHIDRFLIVVKGRRVLGYGEFRAQFQRRGHLAIEKIVVKRSIDLGLGRYQERVEELVREILDEVVARMEERCAVFGL
ncbi:MAG: hypothetical protein GXO19_03010 [Epsilonproteobacteria bacterium]|nr:hypothetical protein [Campylobacterota bacterium]NPA56690.1 hypothetical protein [Campylobacterota bacterium]